MRSWLYIWLGHRLYGLREGKVALWKKIEPLAWWVMGKTIYQIFLFSCPRPWIQTPLYNRIEYFNSFIFLLPREDTTTILNKFIRTKNLSCVILFLTKHYGSLRQYTIPVKLSVSVWYYTTEIPSLELGWVQGNSRRLDQPSNQICNIIHDYDALIWIFSMKMQLKWKSKSSYEHYCVNT